MSNNYQPDFTDQEVLCIFFYCLIVEKRIQVKDIYDFADNYWRTWFPDLPKTYEGFLTRLNELYAVFPPFIVYMLDESMEQSGQKQLVFFAQQVLNAIDSMPIILAKGARRFNAKVAPKLCERGFCSSKNLKYYGLKLHVLGFVRKQKLPLPEFVGISPASNHDLTVVKPLFETLYNRAIYADKIYAKKDFEQWLLSHNNTEILTPVKKKKGQEQLSYKDRIYSFAVSQVRQPIEGFFAWIIEKTGIQNASKVRSEKGVRTHVFARFAAAVMIMCLDFL
ncbi:MAG: transposase [Bacteroidota bacterium]